MTCAPASLHFYDDICQCNAALAEEEEEKKYIYRGGGHFGCPNQSASAILGAHKRDGRPSKKGWPRDEERKREKREI
ncbi:hypothetical protein OUZ56_026708 [Daphnia magna]|uniref:Uncharacterized protein n=1 Tax=Daphnia magna TaxID=35525 RepID=A0ABQ9ZMJ8_9CRUS|nr:hypothetical protein OUZ56_026708 [Daphnia magna]